MGGCWLFGADPSASSSNFPRLFTHWEKGQYFSLLFTQRAWNATLPIKQIPGMLSVFNIPGIKLLSVVLLAPVHRIVDAVLIPASKI